VPVDADGFTLVQSRRRGRRHAPTHPRLLVFASIVWPETTLPPGAPPRPAASSALARSTGRGTASVVVHPGAFPRTVCRSARIHANSVPVARASTTATVVMSLLVRQNCARTKVLSWRLLSLLDRFFARQLRRWRLRVAAHSLALTRHTMARMEPRRGLWGRQCRPSSRPAALCRTVIVATAAPQQQLAGITSFG
jgi:hypothetical protein